MFSEVYNEDVFETMKRIKDKSVNLIICDSPYFKICGKFDWAFKTMQEWIDWHILLRDEFERILADNGSLFVFGDEKNIAYLQVEFDKKFNLLNNIVYKKPSFHPTTKDLSVIEKLILTTTKENDLVFSPFLGSGTDRIACFNTKRNLISCELDKEYFDKAEQRYQEHIRQMKLF
jgi:DNA modification methylase